jgi:hypothetical protein
MARATVNINNQSSLKMDQSDKKVYAVGAIFNDAGSVMSAAEQIRDLGYVHWDVHTPFPVHGMDQAMGLGKSWLSAVVFCGGLIGFTTAVCLTTIPSFWIYPMIVHGKPYDRWTVVSFFPIMFELTVLLSAFAAVGGMLVMNRLPRWNHPVFEWESFTKVSDDSFAIVIESRDPKFSVSKVSELLQTVGGMDVSVIREEA